jgi:hypothetical protein
MTTVLLKSRCVQTKIAKNFECLLPREKLLLRKLISAAGFFAKKLTICYCKHYRRLAARSPSREICSR